MFQRQLCHVGLSNVVMALLTLHFAAADERQHSNERVTLQRGFDFRPLNDRSLGLWDGSAPVFVYNHGVVIPPNGQASQGRGCYFHPVYGLDGEVLTDDFPKDHVYHRGMYWAWPHIKLGDTEYELWTINKGLKQEFEKWLVQEADSQGARLGVQNVWTTADRPIVREVVQVHVHPVSDGGRAIDVELSWTPIDQPLTLWGAEGKSYGGFNFRFGPKARTTITVPEHLSYPDGRHVPAGRANEDLVVTRLPWIDFTDEFLGQGRLSGASIFVHPQHRNFPPTWMARHYGLVSIGWPGVEPQTFPANQPIECRYRIWIHRDLLPIATLQAAYEQYRGR